eukprot:gb/GEZN01007470.1/.p1 GENE.gb/GEZN01007470.1/~~gb/GEZN01007470.1/.p1  ORF type:complete len:403 (+),score=85.75 gb/GEZN01007470.1/:107-1315(+)
MGCGRQETCCCAWMVILIVSSFLLGYSFRIINYDEYGLKYNQINKKIDPEAYSSGRHYVGLGNNFYRFKKTFETVDLRYISTRSKDALQFYLDVSFQFAVAQDKLHILYNEYKFTYADRLTRAAKLELNLVAATYNSSEFFDRRVEIEAAMLAAITSKVESFHLVMKGFQLRAIYLPPNLDDILLTTELTKQQARLANEQRELQVLQTENETTLLKMKQNKTVEVQFIQSQGEAVVAEIQNEATLIRSRTANIEDQLRIQTDTIIFKYNQETDAILTNIRGNVTVIRKLTDQLVSEIDLQTSLLKAQADAEVASIQGDAKAKATRIREEANAQIEIWRQDLESRSVLDIMTNLNMTAEEALVLRWIEAFSKKKNVMLDVFTPPALYLPGQAEKVNAALGVPP